MIRNNKLSMIRECIIHDTVRIMPMVNLYGSVIGSDSFVGPFVEIGGAIIGNRTYISSHSYICPGVTIGDDCFIAHGVMFTNDIFVDAVGWTSPVDKKFVQHKTTVGNHVRIGTGAVILPVRIGDWAVIGAGSVVTHDVPDHAVVYGVPSRTKQDHIINGLNSR